MPAHKILSIAYDPALGKTRQLILTEAGYSVHSALGSEAGMRAAKAGKFSMFIVGHDAPEAERMKMVHWLKENYPKIPIVALQPTIFSGRKFGEAQRAQ